MYIDYQGWFNKKGKFSMTPTIVVVVLRCGHIGDEVNMCFFHEHDSLLLSIGQINQTIIEMKKNDEFQS